MSKIEALTIPNVDSGQKKNLIIKSIDSIIPIATLRI